MKVSNTMWGSGNTILTLGQPFVINSESDCQQLIIDARRSDTCMSQLFHSKCDSLVNVTLVKLAHHKIKSWLA